MDMGEGQNRTSCIDSPMRRRRGVECSENGGRFLQRNPPFLHNIHRTGPFRLTTALRMPTVGVPASPWIWAKARIEPAALIRQCGDGVVSNVARMDGVVLQRDKSTLSAHYIHRTGPFRLTTALRMPTVGVPASPWIWAKARIESAALIRQCGDGVVSNVARMDGVVLQRNPPFLHAHS
jgi:hypothetical protein